MKLKGGVDESRRKDVVKVVGISEGHSGIIVKTMPRKLLSNWMLWG